MKSNQLKARTQNVTICKKSPLVYYTNRPSYAFLRRRHPKPCDREQAWIVDESACLSEVLSYASERTLSNKLTCSHSNG